MKIIIITIVFLLLIPVVGLRSVSAESPFDQYRSNIKWNEEQAHLDNFAIFLVRNPEYIGYIYLLTENDFSVNLRQNKMPILNSESLARL